MKLKSRFNKSVKQLKEKRQRCIQNSIDRNDEKLLSSLQQQRVYKNANGTRYFLFSLKSNTWLIDILILLRMFVDLMKKHERLFHHLMKFENIKSKYFIFDSKMKQIQHTIIGTKITIMLLLLLVRRNHHHHH